MTDLPSGTVTFVLADIEGSTALWEDRPAEMKVAIERFDEVVTEVVERHAGARPVEQGEGDSFLAAFGRATDALEAALALQLEFADLARAWPFRVRMALHAGEVERRGDGNYVGSTVNRCARLRALAAGGETLVSQAVVELVADRLPAGATLDPLGLRRLRDLTRPEQVYRLHHPDLPALPQPTPGDRHNLPAELTSFIGRAAEIDAVVDLVLGNRMVSLLGTGGSGKTRLSLQVASRLLAEHPEGTWFVELASIDDPAMVPQAVADVVGARSRPGRRVTDAVAVALEGKPALVLLDNCEHVIGGASELAAALLSRCRDLRILATSREPLGVAGELTFTVPTLSLPPAGTTDMVRVMSSEAVQLFADRARRARAGFEVTEENAAAVAEVCRQLDGVPLAVELAAARARSLTLEQIRAGLSDRFRLLQSGPRSLSPRQRSLLASVDWSFALLTEAERSALAWLSVFAGGFDLEAAESVVSDGALDRLDVLDALSSLVDKSLLHVEDAGEARYGMLETIREFAGDRLASSGSEAVEHARLRHRHHYLEVLRQAAKEEEGPEQASWSARVRRDFDNVRAALQAAKAEGDGDALLEMTCLAGNTWTLLGQSGEHRAWLEGAMALARPDASFRPNALYQLGVTENFAGDLDGAIEHIGASVPLYRAKGDEIGALWAESEYAWNLSLGRGLEVGQPVYEAAIARAEELGAAGVLFSLEHGLGTCLAYAGHLADGVARLERALSRPPVVEHFVRWARIMLGSIDSRTGAIERAVARLGPPTEEGRAAGDTMSVFLGSLVQAEAAVFAGDVPTAVDQLRLLGPLAEVLGPYAVAGVRATEALAALARGLTGPALAGLDEAIEIAERATPPWAVLFSVWKAEALAAAGDVMAAMTAIDATIHRARARDHPAMLGVALVSRARLHAAAGDAEEAGALAREALPILGREGHIGGLIEAIELFGLLASDAGGAAEATRLWAAAATARGTTGYRFRWPVAAGDMDTAVAGARAALGDDEFAGAWRDGERMSLDEARGSATRGHGERPRAASGWEALTAMEEKVAALVAEGLTNRQIGERLFISRHTVDTHLRHVFAKIGVSTRVDLAARAARRMA